jgi:hypothetical protein
VEEAVKKVVEKKEAVKKAKAKARKALTADRMARAKGKEVVPTERRRVLMNNNIIVSLE